jgi:hypothetical protein
MAYIRPENDMLIVAANVKIITFRISTLRIPDRAFKRISMRQAAKQAILNEPKDEPKAQTKWMGLFIGFSEILGGADRDRTGGLLVANQALSQLSYSPFFSCQPSAFSHQEKDALPED